MTTPLKPIIYKGCSEVGSLGMNLQSIEITHHVVSGCVQQDLPYYIQSCLHTGDSTQSNWITKLCCTCHVPKHICKYPCALLVYLCLSLGDFIFR